MDLSINDGFVFCRRKKKCIRYLEGDNGNGSCIGSPDDNLGSVGSTGEAVTPDSKTGGESDMDKSSSDIGMSSPSFSLTSPGMFFDYKGARYDFVCV